ncbi:hypothetical protein MY8738_004416 [Beauveria namnaoensis]
MTHADSLICSHIPPTKGHKIAVYGADEFLRNPVSRTSASEPNEPSIVARINNDIVWAGAAPDKPSLVQVVHDSHDLLRPSAPETHLGARLDCTGQRCGSEINPEKTSHAN